MKKLAPLILATGLAFSGCSKSESCEKTVYSQNQLPYEGVYGTALREAPSLEAEKVREPGFLPNEEISIRGWVEVEEVAYPENPEPWNGTVWFAVADEDGWVNYAAVRKQPTEIVRLVDGSLVENPPTLEEMRSQLVDLDPTCEITK